MWIAIEYIQWLDDERAKINSADLKDIVFFKNGQVADIPDKVYGDFELTGLNNVDFITSKYYRRE